jgi:hypothetical protein
MPFIDVVERICSLFERFEDGRVKMPRICPPVTVDDDAICLLMVEGRLIGAL